MNSKFNIPSFYYIMHRDIVKNFGHSEVVFRKDIVKLISRAHNLSYELIVVLVKEMENFGLLEPHNAYKVSIKPLKSNPIDNTSKLYHSVGLW